MGNSREISSRTQLVTAAKQAEHLQPASPTVSPLFHLCWCWIAGQTRNCPHFRCLLCKYSMMTEPLPHSKAASLKNPRLKEFKGGSTSHYPSSSIKPFTAFEQVIYGCSSYEEKYRNRGAPFEMPSSAECSGDNLNSASISDGLPAKKKKIVYTSSHLTCMQATGNSAKFNSPNGDRVLLSSMPPYITKAF